jgi:hypothetical protein
MIRVWICAPDARTGINWISPRHRNGMNYTALYCITTTVFRSNDLCYWNPRHEINIRMFAWKTFPLNLSWPCLNYQNRSDIVVTIFTLKTSLYISVSRSDKARKVQCHQLVIISYATCTLFWYNPKITVFQIQSSFPVRSFLKFVVNCTNVRWIKTARMWTITGQ